MTEAGLAPLGNLVNLEALRLVVPGHREGRDTGTWSPYPREDMERDVWRLIALRRATPHPGAAESPGQANAPAVAEGMRNEAREMIERAGRLLKEAERLLREAEALTK